MERYDVKMTVDVRGLDVRERQLLAKKKSMTLKPGEIIEVITDDDRMPTVAGRMAEALGTLELIEVRKERDKLYHGYFRRE